MYLFKQIVISNPIMSIVDVDALIFTDIKGNILYKKIYNLEEKKITHVIKKSLEEKDPICLLDNNLLFVHKNADLCVIMVSNSENNEVFLYKCFEQFIAAMSKISKKFSVESMHKKFDVYFLLSDIFVYEGVIMEDKSEIMLKRLPTRTFENLEGMKVPKGMASIISNATKSFSRYI
ncbi:coatomer zeta subunit [Nosema bombycis CQ1]|uniref:Coatomer zeta subunit n=1 Tax=Nosema bombycis (strain CQ1 / CVCC 102059) TaxID=578461 RepID=R0KMC0_NOSB1|nr:coatomer zeta subunit [Nosema bombycis CQ1]|eukprot:EOB11287.1 coatomer zeta subunit [Nosema bombycis CQ1]